MSLEAGTLIGMAIGMVGVICLAGFSIWSKHQEDKEKHQRGG